MARPIRVSILADPKDFVAGMKAAEQAADTAADKLSGADRVFASLDSAMSKVSGTADFISGEFGRVGAGITGIGDRLTEMNPQWAGLGGALSETGKNLTLVSDAMDVVTGVANTAQAAVGLLKDSTLLQSAATKAGAVAQWAMNAAMSANPVMLIVLAIAALVAGLIWFFTQTEVGKQAWAAFTDFIGKAWEATAAFLSATWDAVSGAFSAGVAAVGGFMQQVWDVIKLVWEWSPYGIIITNWDKIMAFFGKIPGWVKSIFDAAVSWLATAGSNILKGLQNGATTAWNTVNGWLGGIPGKIKDVFSGAVSWLTSAGGNLLTGLWNGISDKVSWIYSKLSGMVNSVIDYIKNLFGIHSPSTVMADMGGNLLAGLANGLKDTSAVESAMARVSDNLTGAFTPDLGLVGAGGTVVQNYYSFGDLSFSPANAQEEDVLAKFVAMAQRKARAGV